jgi:hypothetical protein
MTSVTVPQRIVTSTMGDNSPTALREATTFPAQNRAVSRSMIQALTGARLVSAILWSKGVVL